MRKSFSGNAAPTTLGAGISPTDTSFGVLATTGWPDTTVGPFVVTVDRGQGTLEEKILVPSYAGTTLNGVTRGWDGTTPQSHSMGATVVCTLDADTINQANEVVNGVGTSTPSTSAVGDAASDGTAVTTPAAGDHKHARESFTTGATSASNPGDTENDGSSASPARADHKHAREASTLGESLQLTGATTATRYVGGTVSGAPVSGTFDAGDFVIDRSGTIWICTNAGTPGTWTTPYPFAQPSARIYFTGAQSLPSGASTKLTSSTTAWAKGGLTVASDAVVVALAGIYRVSAGNAWPANANSGAYGGSLLQNGSVPSNGPRGQISYGQGGSGGPAYPFTVSWSDEVECAAADTLALAGFQSIGGPASNAAGSWMSVSMVTQ